MILHKNEPIIISSIGRDGSVQYYDLSGDNLRVCDIKDLDIKPISGRWIRHRANSSFYITRIPIRGGGYKQGMQYTNTALYGPEGASMGLSSSAFISIMKMYSCVYPTYDEALRCVRKAGGSVPFKKDFCLVASQDGVGISYKGYGVVGTISSDDKVEFRKSWKHLEKRL